MTNATRTLGNSRTSECDSARTRARARARARYLLLSQIDNSGGFMSHQRSSPRLII